jgi:hypothetical protein
MHDLYWSGEKRSCNTINEKSKLESDDCFWNQILLTVANPRKDAEPVYITLNFKKKKIDKRAEPAYWKQIRPTLPDRLD